MEQIVNVENVEKKEIGFETSVDEMQRFMKFVRMVASDDSIERFSVKEGKLYFKNTDPAHVAMLELSMPGLSKVTGDAEFAVSLESITRFLKVMNKKDLFSIEHLDKEFLYIQCDKIQKRIELKELAGIPIPKDPPQVLKAEFTIDVKKLHKTMRAIETIVDYLEIVVDADGVKFIGEGDDNKISREFKQDEVVIKKVEDAEKGKYSIMYLMDFIDTLKKQKIDDVTIMFSTDEPLKATFEAPCLDNKKLSGVYWLAPRIEY